MYDPNKGQIKPGSKIMMPPLKPVGQAQQTPQVKKVQVQQNVQVEQQKIQTPQQAQQPPQMPPKQIKIQSEKRPKTRILESLIILLVLFVGIYLLLSTMGYLDTFPKGKAKEVFTAIDLQYAQKVNQSDLNLGVEYALNLTNSIITKDNNFFASKLDSIPDGINSSEKTYALVQAEGMVLLDTAIATLYLTSFLQDFNRTESKEKLLEKLNSTPSINNEINKVKERLNTRPATLDYSKFPDENKSKDGLSVGFLNRSKQYTYEYLNQYMDYKVGEFNKNLDLNNIIISMIEAKQIHTMYNVFADWPISFD